MRAYPVPNWSGIPKESVINAVTTCTMTDEQRAWMESIPPQKNPKPAYRMRAEPKEVEEMRPMLHPNVDKEYIIAAFAEGKSAAQIERENGMTINTLQIRLKTFGIVNPNAKNRTPQEKAEIAAKKPIEEAKPVDCDYEIVDETIDVLKLTSKSGETFYADASDMVNHPDHYTTGGIEVIDYLKAKLTDEEFAGFCKGNIIKYLSREKHKGGIESLKKAQWYLNRLIEC